MGRIPQKRSAWILQRWEAWLNCHMEAEGITDYALARRTISIPRSRIAQWRSGNGPVPGPGVVFNVGQALSSLGVADAAGPVALFAAGHFRELIQFFGKLMNTGRAGAKTAILLYSALPIAVEQVEDVWLNDKQRDLLCGTVNVTKSILRRLLIAEVSKFEAVWDNRVGKMENSGAAFWLFNKRIEHASRIFANDDACLDAFVSAWILLRQWADDIAEVIISKGDKYLKEVYLALKGADEIWFMARSTAACSHFDHLVAFIKSQQTGRNVH